MPHAQCFIRTVLLAQQLINWEMNILRLTWPSKGGKLAKPLSQRMANLKKSWAAVLPIPEGL